jgi:acetolactate synthase-1/2/3 large subunit
VIHVGATPATVEQVYFPHAEVVGDVGASLALPRRPARGQAPNRRALLGCAKGFLRASPTASTEDRFR